MKKHSIFITVLLILMLVLTGCDNKKDELSTQETIFKIIDKETKETIKIAEFKMSNANGIKVTGENGLYKATLTVGNSYNIKVNADGYKDVDMQYKAVKTGAVYEVPMDRHYLIVQGTIKDNAGKAVNGATVKLINGSKEFSAYTDKDGKYIIQNVPANVGDEDKYKIIVTAPNYAPIETLKHICEKSSVLMSVNNDNDNIQTLKTTANKEEVEEKLVFNLDINLGNIDQAALRGNIKGKITDNNNKPIPRVKVTIIDSTPSITTITNNEGEYALNDIVIGKYRLVFEHIDKHFYDAEREVTVEEEKTTIVDMVMEKIKGTISGKTTPGNVEIYIGGEIVATSDNDGNYKIEELLPGEYTLTYRKNNYIEKTLTVAVHPGINTPNTNITLDPKPGTVTGRVRGRASNIQNAVIRIDGKETRTGNDGRFTVNNITPNTPLTLEVSADLYEDKIIRNIIISPGENKNLGDIELIARASGNGNLVINVKDQNDNDITANIYVEGYGSVSNVKQRVINNIPVKSYNIKVSKNGYYTEDRTVTLISDETVTVDITMKPIPVTGTGTLKGRVTMTSPEGNVIPLAGVKLEYNGYSAVTDDNGYYTMILPVGRYTGNMYLERRAEYIDYESKYTTSNIGNIDLKEGNVVTKNIDIPYSIIQINRINSQPAIRYVYSDYKVGRVVLHRSSASSQTASVSLYDIKGNICVSLPSTNGSQTRYLDIPQFIWYIRVLDFGTSNVAEPLYLHP